MRQFLLVSSIQALYNPFTHTHTHIPPGVRIVATDLCRERVGPYMCDFRRPTTVTTSQFPEVHIAQDVLEQDPFRAPGAGSEDEPVGCSETEEGCPKVQARAKV